MTYECWKESPEAVLLAIMKLFNLIVTFSKTPKEWKRANIIPIPKATDWGMDIDKTRPITLLETLRKIFTKILTNRIEEICRKLDVLKGNNCSVLKGTSTHCPINIIKNVLEDVNTFCDGKLWLVLQDMKKAYDSVGWSSLERALTRIKMNKKYIAIMKDLHLNRKSSVITAYGPTSPHHVQDGLDQGETHAPILWRIFYDPLLCAVGKSTATTGYHMQRVPNTPSPGINHLAFVDDTAWIANSKSSMTRILATADSFFKTNDIEINKQKTVCILGKGKRNRSNGDVISPEDSTI